MDLRISEISPETAANAALIFQTSTGYHSHTSTKILYPTHFMTLLKLMSMSFMFEMQQLLAASEHWFLGSYWTLYK